jgi:hypothetical protein
LSLLAARDIAENKGKTVMQLAVENFNSLLGILSEVGADKKQVGFAWNYYRPYFVEMKARNYVEAFCYYIHQSDKSAEVSAWLTMNAQKVNEFLAWSKSYKWNTHT